MGNSSIFNSKKLLILHILSLVIIITSVESLLYKIPKKHQIFKNSSFFQDQKVHCFVLGDSRAASGINPEILGNYISLAEEGGDVSAQLNRLLDEKIKIDTLIVVVSPASLFGVFVKPVNSINSLESRLYSFGGKIPYFGFFLHPSIALENKINSFLSSRIIANHGINLLKYFLTGHLEKFHTSYGWQPMNKLFGDKYYASYVNDIAYSSRLIETYTDTSFISGRKNDFRELINKFTCRVFLIRLPIGSNIHKHEEERFPWFDSYIYNLQDSNVVFVQIKNFEYSYSLSDDSHLNEEQARSFSSKLKEVVRNN